jgi:hypothetical protein
MGRVNKTAARVHHYGAFVVFRHNIGAPNSGIGVQGTDTK